jgi:hypothetical protein
MAGTIFEVLLSLVYRLVKSLLRLLKMLIRSDLSKDVELLVLRHENQVPSRHPGGRPQWDHIDRLRLTALSRLMNHRRWPQTFPVTPATILRWHRDLISRKRTYTDRRWGISRSVIRRPYRVSNEFRSSSVLRT